MPTPATSGPAAPTAGTAPLRRAMWQAMLANALLLAAGLRHHLVWGGSLHWLLDAFETGCLVGFAWLGARAWLTAMREVGSDSPGLRRLVLTTLPILAVAIAVPTFLSADSADYVMRGRVLALHGGNPYVDMATAYPDDPFLQFGDEAWKGFPLPYGPIVADLQGAIAWLAHRFASLPPFGEFVVAIALFKSVFAACVLAAAWLARDLAARAGWPAPDVAFVVVAWNPLLLNEAVAAAHNESLVLLTLLLAVRCAVAARSAYSGFALGLGVLTKIVPVVLGPILLVWSLRQRRFAAFAVGGAAALALLGVYYLRFFAAPGSLDFLQKQSAMSGASPVWLVATLTGLEVATVLRCGQAAVVVAVLSICVALWRSPRPGTLVAGCAAAMLAMVCLGMAGFRPWYHVWWVPIAMLAPPGWLPNFAMAVSITAPLCHVVWTSTRSYEGLHPWMQLTMGLLVPAVLATRLRPPLPPPRAEH